MASPKVLAFSGSIRTESLNKKLLHHVAGLARKAGIEVNEIDLGEYELPLYNGDLEAAEGLPDNAKKLKELFKSHAGLLIACPEYNGSITPLLKNTIDWVSRPMEGEKPLEPFQGKITALVAASPGGLGGVRGLAHVSNILHGIGCVVLPGQVAIPAAHKNLDEHGAPSDERHASMLQALISRLARFVGTSD